MQPDDHYATPEASGGETPPRPRWLRTPGAAVHCDLGKSTLEKRRVTGDGPPFVKMGAVVLYDRADLDRWLEERKVLSTSQRPMLEPGRWLSQRKTRNCTEQLAEVPSLRAQSCSLPQRPGDKPVRQVRSASKRVGSA